MGEYGGIVDFGADGYRSARRPWPCAGAVRLAPHYLTADASPTLAQSPAVHRRRSRHHGTLLVEYDLYAMRSRALEKP